MIVRGASAAVVMLAAVILLAAGATFAGCAERKAASELPPNLAYVLSVTERPDRAPEFTWSATDGGAVSFDRERGSVTLVNFWATWCAPCKKELPDLVELSRTYADRGFRVIGVATDRTPNAAELVADFLRSYAIPYQNVLSTQEMEDAFGNVRAMPTSILVDRDGRIVQTIVGIRSRAQLEAIITPLL